MQPFKQHQLQTQPPCCLQDLSFYPHATNTWKFLILSLLELMGQSLDHTDWKLFLNEKGFVDHGKYHAMYSVMTLQEVMKSNTPRRYVVPKC
jgi:hypothetical protein